MESLTKIISEIKQNPADFNLWLKYAQTAQENQNWKVSSSGYLTCLALNPTPETFEKYTTTYQKHINSLNLDDFHFDVFKLINKKVVINLSGIFNMEVKPFENNIQNLLAQNTKHIFLDFSFMKNLTGLGPSTIKKSITWCKENNTPISAVAIPECIKNVFNLKKIEITEYPNIFVAFNS